MLRWMNRSTAGGKSRAEKIAAMVEKIAGSDLSVDEFFRRYTVPAEIELTKEVRRVKLRRNPKDPEGMKRSEEHTSELQSHSDLVCRLLLEKKKKKETTSNRQL